MENLPLMKPELWGGIECTINRVGDRYFDQLQYSGHYDRDDDVDLIASLGIKALRYPVLWERHEPAPHTTIHWKKTAKRLARIRQLGIKPIVGLLHHGSGPAFTNLLADNFPELLAAYAGKVAARFPWIEYYTPVNEPLTTARFSGLYGHWYPHHSNDISFAKMLLNQLRGVVLSMKAIRKINPAAKLIQTEDLSKTYSSERLSYQAHFENERRWLSFDLLCGRLRPGFAMYDYFLRLGISEADLMFFIDNPCPPHIIGANYYITSERYLDERLNDYPSHVHGGNELHTYADVEAVRIDHKQPWGFKLLLKEAWERFRLPLAVTENHLNCSREEQLRWINGCWEDVNALVAEGIDIRAFTAWALLGSFGWNKLLTSEEMDYETGAFDVRSPQPRATAIAQWLSAVSTGKPVHAVCNGNGWWKLEKQGAPAAQKEAQQPLLIIGKTGTLGTALAKTCKKRNIAFYAAGRKDADITNANQLEDLISKIRPWAVINTAGFVDIDLAETNIQQCFALNTAAPVLMAEICRRLQIQFITLSSDQVFDGKQPTPYHETAIVNPLNIYGQSKAMAESQVKAIYPETLIIRTSAFFGPWDSANFAAAVIKVLSEKKCFDAAANIFISPTYVPDLAETLLDLVIDQAKGIWHISQGNYVSWAAFAKKIAKKAGLDHSLINAVQTSFMNWSAVRPAHSILANSPGIYLPSLEDAINRYLEKAVHGARATKV